MSAASSFVATETLSCSCCGFVLRPMLKHLRQLTVACQEENHNNHKTMQKEKKQPLGRSAESLVGIWVGKQIKPDIELRAKEESVRTGVDLTGNALAKEIFLWAYSAYVKVGSLAALKQIDVRSYSPERKVATELLETVVRSPAPGSMDPVIKAKAAELLELRGEAYDKTKSDHATKRKRDRSKAG